MSLSPFGRLSHQLGVIITVWEVIITFREVIITVWEVIITIWTSLSPFGRHYHQFDLSLTEGVGEMITTVYASLNSRKVRASTSTPVLIAPGDEYSSGRWL